MNLVISRNRIDFFAGLSILAAAVYALYLLRTAYHMPLNFDDSFMFYRYATNIRHGLGISWNLDGVHTYGETAPLWGIIVLMLSFLPTSPGHTLILGSWLCGLGALLAMAWAVARNAESGIMKSPWRVLPLVAIPLLLSRVYRENLVSGMETMLAATLSAVFVGLALGWETTRVRPKWLALTGIALFLTRPEMALVVVLVPVMLAFFGLASRRGVLLFEAMFLSGLILDLVFCKLYFGTPLPLSFYMKSGHAYEGFSAALHPFSQAVLMLANCLPFLATLALLSRQAEWRIAASFILPTLVAFAYLCTVTQLMGWYARYYAPYFPLFVIPALMIVDRRLRSARELHSWQWLQGRALVVGGTVAVFALAIPLVGTSRLKRLLGAADRIVERGPYRYDPVQFETSASRPLPYTGWERNIQEVGDVLLAPLPKGVTMASSEVGYLGVANPGANIIDMEGLNDNQIALHGFNVESLLKRRPDIIWMPHSAYTYQRGLIMSDPELLEHYAFYSGAAGYGIALRKDSPIRPLLDKQMAILWQDFYPTYRMSDYRVRAARWTRRKYEAAAD